MTGIFIGVAGLMLVILAASTTIASRRKRPVAAEGEDYIHGMEIDLREISNTLHQRADINAFIALTYVQMFAIALSWSRHGWTLDSFENTVEEVTEILAREIRTHHFSDIGSIVRDTSRDVAEDPVRFPYWSKLLAVEVTGKADIGVPERGPTAFDAEDFFEWWNTQYAKFGADKLEVPPEIAKASDDLMAKTRAALAT